MYSTTPRRRSGRPPLARAHLISLLCLLLWGCASTPEIDTAPCTRPDGEAAFAQGLSEQFAPEDLEGRWRFWVAQTTGTETPFMVETVLALQPSPDSLFAHPLCLERGDCPLEYPLYGYLERPVSLPWNGVTDPTSPDPEAPGVVVEWRPGAREAVLNFGNPPVNGALRTDSGTFFWIVDAEAGSFSGYWQDGGFMTVLTDGGRDLGPPGGWFCGRRVG